MKRYDIDTGQYGNGYKVKEDAYGEFVYYDDVEKLKELNREVKNKLNDILRRVELSPSVQFDFDEVLRLLVAGEAQ